MSLKERLFQVSEPVNSFIEPQDSDYPRIFDTSDKYILHFGPDDDPEAIIEFEAPYNEVIKAKLMSDIKAGDRMVETDSLRDVRVESKEELVWLVDTEMLSDKNAAIIQFGVPAKYIKDLA